MTNILIEKAASSEKLKRLINSEFERYETRYGISYHVTPFCFTAREENEIIGIVTGYTCYHEVHISELVVMENHRGEKIGTRLINAVEEHYRGCGFDSMDLSTREFQAPGFYEKCGFTLEFVRKCRDNPKLNRYFYVKYFEQH